MTIQKFLKENTDLILDLYLNQNKSIDEIVKRSKDILSTSHLHTVKLRDYLNWIYTQHGSGVSIVLKVGL